MTIVAGRIVYESGRITTVDEAALRAEMRELMAAGRAQQQAAAREAARLEPYYRQMVMRAASEDVGMNRWLN
jgi:5-methylthioadenosine/S-adenosylhomocysteine deaminase